METLQRLYGISFPDVKMLKEWEKFQEEAKNRDHRKIGRVRDFLLVYFLNSAQRLRSDLKGHVKDSTYLLILQHTDVMQFTENTVTRCKIK